jgi:hypothetical protein
VTPTRINLAATAPQTLSPGAPGWSEPPALDPRPSLAAETNAEARVFRGLFYAMVISAFLWAGIILLILRLR